jgi:hypothetical protein
VIEYATNTFYGGMKITVTKWIPTRRQQASQALRYQTGWNRRFLIMP